MDTLLIFNEKPRNASKEEAIKIANECELFIEKERYKVIFHENDDLFKKLFLICGKWSTTQLFVDNKEYNVETAFNVMNNCFNRGRCNGICILANRNGICDYNDLFGLIGLVTGSIIPSQHHIDQFKNSIIGLDFIKKIDENTYSLNKEELQARIIKESEVPLIFCPLPVKEKIIQKIGSLPEKIQIKTRQDERIPPKKDTIDPQRYVGLTDFQKERYKELAQLVAPIFAQEIMKELMKLMQEIAEKSEEKETK